METDIFNDWCDCHQLPALACGCIRKDDYGSEIEEDVNAARS